jgi:sulfonate transport system permease protein
VELLASSEGLGFMLVWGRQLFQLDLVLSAIIVVGLVGLALDKSLALVEARLLRWRASAELEVGRGRA